MPSCWAPCGILRFRAPSSPASIVSVIFSKTTESLGKSSCNNGGGDVGGGQLMQATYDICLLLLEHRELHNYNAIEISMNDHSGFFTPQPLHAGGHPHPYVVDSKGPPAARQTRTPALGQEHDPVAPSFPVQPHVPATTTGTSIHSAVVANIRWQTNICIASLA